ncbi:MAG TPA: hypothetical protein VE442_00785 [Jatrophihabitans sp.]|jgi:hypothetical protein|nr:hypothetical protein [Jatrophihabitans sp.]
MGGNQQPPEPAGYSTQMGGNYDSGYHTTGYRQVIIDPRTLDESINGFRKQLDGQSPRELMDTLTNAVVDSGAFGQIPNAEKAYSELKKFVSDHVEAMTSMGVSLADFIARVQAAAQMGYDADPVTRQQAAAARAHHYPMAE